MVSMLNTCCSIIAVTGLGGHAFGSWSYSPRYMWLRDFLPKDLPHVRVLTYGYNSQLKTASSRNILGDHVRMFKQRLITLPGSATVSCSGLESRHELTNEDSESSSSNCFYRPQSRMLDHQEGMLLSRFLFKTNDFIDQGVGGA